jgi:cell division protein FtsB
LREQVSKYREELEEKSKEIAALKEKIDSLRGNNMVLQR